MAVIHADNQLSTQTYPLWIQAILLFITFLLLLILYLVYSCSCRNQVEKAVKTKSDYQQAKQQSLDNNRRIAEAKLLSLRMQMNPHFVFNSLNAINKFVLQNDSEQASRYLAVFATLMRQVLVNTQTDWVSLHDELIALRSYIELEQLRCDKHFEVNVQVDSSLNAESVQVPPLLIQPFVENAIRHGLLPQLHGQAQLKIECRRVGNQLSICIADNGIGRTAAANMHARSKTKNQLHGSQITQERIALVNDIYNVNARVESLDLVHTDGQPAGTCITFTQNLKPQ